MQADGSSRGPYRGLRLAAAAALAFAAPAALADFGEYRSHALAGQALTVETSVGTLTLEALNDATFAVHYAEPGVRQLPSFARAGEPAPLTTALGEFDDALSFSAGSLTAVIDKSPVRIRYLRDGEPVVSEEHGYFAYETVRGFRFALDDGEKLAGGGERVLGMDRRGRRMPLYNRASYGYGEAETEQMYFGLPAVLSSDRYILAFDNTASGWLDVGSTEKDVLQFEAAGGRTGYIVSAGSTYPDLIEAFTGAVGRQPMPPRWAFGNYASRFGYRTEAETRDVVQRFRDADIPLDGVILDLYWFGPEIQGYMGNLDWDREAFPTPERMIADFRDDGVKTIVITEPFVLTASDQWQDAVQNDALARNVTGQPKTFDFYFGNTGLIDVFSDAGSAWFWQRYARLFNEGVAGTWGDLGEPEVHPGDSLHTLSGTGIQATGDEVHNAYGHRWAELVFENHVATFPERRPVVLMRAGFLGSQRFGMMPWTGDVDRSWSGLKPQVELSLQMGLLGLAYTHSDLGGFAGGESFDRELYLRWLLYGVFQPVYRPHAQEHIAPEAVFHDKKTIDLARDFIRLRYALLPYVYTLAWENTTTGMPLMRPLMFEDETDPALFDEGQAYFWGDAFLVKPVTDPDTRRVDVALPDGAWFNFFSGRRYEGGRTASIPVDLETIPVLVRAGAFVPMAPVVDSTDDYSSAALTLHYYDDATVERSSGRVYEDDGASRSSIARGEFELLEFWSERKNGALVIGLDRRGGRYAGMPASREMTLVVHNVVAEPGSVTIGRTTIPVGRRRAPAASAWFDADASTLSIRFNWDHSALTLGFRE